MRASNLPVEYVGRVDWVSVHLDQVETGEGQGIDCYRDAFHWPHLPVEDSVECVRPVDNVVEVRRIRVNNAINQPILKRVTTYTATNEEIVGTSHLPVEGAGSSDWGSIDE